ncbi:sensor domain-containing phosphodiesterase [Marinobacterium sp. AK62]|uniref:Sensor domain-containing phosphodiesterase n=1 Tax=Marinobacterium alkalitolerans TaxID=1542925 RepID=A0ABS3ZDP8_9GAMM|nr:sensor domain-containing phosphodiesterase [Marinobacterium alkalitolerans]MBP0049826.1 sensor domain-containing phosphodiesterase [Marinobacterium alkalitolerans]
MSSSDHILSALAGQHPEDKSSRNINILFAHCDNARMEQLLTNLRAAHFAPRGQAVHSLEELKHCLEMRTWDILLVHTRPGASSGLNIEESQQWLKQQGRDLPCILLHPSDETTDPVHWLSLGVDAVVDAHNEPWLMLALERTYQQLQHRRELRSAQTELQQLTERNHLLTEGSSTAICYLRDNTLVYANPACVRLLGYDSAKRLLGHRLGALVAPHQSDRLSECLHQAQEAIPGEAVQLTFYRPDQTMFEGCVSASRSEYEGSPCLIVDIRQPESEAEAFQYIDPTTGLRNHKASLQALETACARARRGGQDRSLLLLRLDHLDVIRSEVGIDGEGLILRAIARTLKQTVNPAHELGRLDDDSFIVLMQNSDPNKALNLGQALCHAIRNHVCSVANTSIHTTVSIGIVMINDSAPPPATLLEHAHEAADSLHQGNRPGNGVQLYSPDQGEISQLDGKMNRRLANALRLNRFRLLYQPVVPLRLEPPAACYEVLLRLMSDSNKAISPNAFIIQTIEPDILRELDRWVVKHALSALQAPEIADQHIALFINLSGPSIRCNELPEWLAETLTQTTVAPSQLVFQISESDAAVDLMAARRFVRAMKQLGCRTCLKHFGSSPNSAHVRRELETEFVKLDSSYMRDLQNDSLDLETLETLLDPLREQKRTLIAPQVETTHVIPELYTAGIHLLQGHYLQPPREQMDYDFFNDRDS